MHHEYLAVDTTASTDAYDGDMNFGCDSGCESGGYFFENEGEASYFFEHVSVVNEFLASCSSFARTAYVPNLLIDCGVRPRCPITGMPAQRIRSIDSRISAPPSILLLRHGFPS